MKVSRFIKEELLIIFLSTLYMRTIAGYTSSLVVIELLALLLLFAIFELLSDTFYRKLFFLTMTVLILFQILHPIYLVLTTYFFTKEYHLWSLLAFFVLWLVQAPSLILYLFVLLAIYLAMTTKKIERLSLERVNLIDSLNEEKIRSKLQEDSLTQSKQTDLEVAILEERNRISHQLHDAVGHSLARSITQIEAMKTLPQSDILNKQLHTLQASLKDGMNDIRETIHDIHHESLNLSASIHELQNELLTLNIHYQESIESSLKYAFKLELLTIIRETIYNSIKHSNATDIRVVIQEYRGILKLSIKDNGSDFNPKNPIQDGIGQTMIRQIATKYQASTIIRYQDGYLTQIIFNKDTNQDAIH